MALGETPKSPVGVYDHLDNFLSEGREGLILGNGGKDQLSPPTPPSMVPLQTKRLISSPTPQTIVNMMTNKVASDQVSLVNRFDIFGGRVLYTLHQIIFHLLSWGSHSHKHTYYIYLPYIYFSNFLHYCSCYPLIIKTGKTRSTALHGASFNLSLPVWGNFPGTS